MFYLLKVRENFVGLPISIPIINMTLFNVMYHVVAPTAPNKKKKEKKKWLKFVI